MWYNYGKLMKREIFMQQRNLIPPKNDSDFEEIMKIYARLQWNKNFVLCGRKGQSQYGIDIWDLQDSDRVIQCKNYSADRSDKFLEEIKKDYDNAVTNYKNIKFFVAATTIPDDVKIQQFIADMNEENRQNFVPIIVELLSWNDISDFIKKHSQAFQKEGFYMDIMFPVGEEDVHTDNEVYAKSFSETLFLHKEQPDSKVNLCNLFVVPKYKENEYDNPKIDLEDKLSAFMESDKRFLFIEGDAGCGKSTLVSWLNYHLQSNDDTAKKIFGNRQVITIRLRSLNKKIISENGLMTAILKYMNLDDKKDLHKRFPNAVMILDGFDELCMIEGISDYNSLIYNFHSDRIRNYHYIITSRRQYIKSNIDIPNHRITLQHFDKDNREKWIEHYTSPDCCGQALNDEIKDYIINISDDTDSAICDTPMTLYMLAAKNISKELTKNSWELYNHIFYHELSETEYTQMIVEEHESYENPVYQHRDILYRISEEIAYGMYQKNNNELYVVSDEIEKIITYLSGKEAKLRNNDALQKMVGQCYALCNYWKETGDGAVEFYHNNIRDFFLCEKIYRELNAIYRQRDLSKDNVQPLIDFFKQFTKAPLQDMVCKFILLRAEKDVNDKNSFVYKEKNQRLLPYLFEKMLTEHKHYKSLDEERHITAIVNILSCTAQVYRHIYEPILTEKEYMKWWNSVDNINEKSDIITYCFRYIFEHSLMNGYETYISSRIDIYLLNWFGSDLRYMDFQGANLSGADLRGATLPDGFKSDSQEEQILHLKDIDIEELKI